MSKKRKHIHDYKRQWDGWNYDYFVCSCGQYAKDAMGKSIRENIHDDRSFWPYTYVVCGHGEN